MQLLAWEKYHWEQRHLPFFTGVGAGAETGSFSPSDLKIYPQIFRYNDYNKDKEKRWMHVSCMGGGGH